MEKLDELKMEVGRIYLRHTRNFCAKSLKEATGYLRQTPSFRFSIRVVLGTENEKDRLSTNHHEPTTKLEAILGSNRLCVFSSSLENVLGFPLKKHIVISRRKKKLLKGV